MRKRVFSYSNFWMTVVSFGLLIACVILYVITGLQADSANSKRSDLVKYSDVCASAYLYSQSELYSFANTGKADHYNNYNNAVSDSGTFNAARKVLEEIGLNKGEKDIFKEFDKAYSEHILPINETAIDYMVKKSDFTNGKKVLNNSEYLDYSTYGYVCLSTLSDTVYDRMTETLSSIESRNHVIMICMIILAFVFGFMLIFTQSRINKLSLLLEESLSKEESEERNG